MKLVPNQVAATMKQGAAKMGGILGMLVGAVVVAFGLLWLGLALRDVKRGYTAEYDEESTPLGDPRFDGIVDEAYRSVDPVRFWAMILVKTVWGLLFGGVGVWIFLYYLRIFLGVLSEELTK